MNRCVLSFGIVVICVQILCYSVAWAQYPADIKGRCVGDELNSILADNRNLWAFACNLISQEDYDHATSISMYWTFQNLRSDFPTQAPTSMGAPCDRWKKLTLCPLGCFAASERLLFGGQYMTPAYAAESNVEHVTALSKNSHLGNLKFTEEKIHYYVVGEESKPLIRIVCSDLSTLDVTSGHPMVDFLGNIVRADELTVGSMLMKKEGPVVVEKLINIAYDGLVWNVRPVSKEPLANIHVAEGFLTGSLRYQNEWATEAARIDLRKNLNTENIEVD